MDVVFEWDEAKAEANLRKHGVDFRIARMVFDDPFAILRQDRIEDGELLADARDGRKRVAPAGGAWLSRRPKRTGYHPHYLGTAGEPRRTEAI